MSGVFLIVWDEKRKDETPVLRPTAGGWPHITLYYSGNVLSHDCLLTCAQSAMRQLVGKTITFSSVRLNSFEKSPGNVVHYVLLDLDEKSAAAIETARTESLSDASVSETQRSKIFMRVPHVSYQISDSRAEAEKARLHLEEYLPYSVTITGATID